MQERYNDIMSQRAAICRDAIPIVAQMINKPLQIHAVAKVLYRCCYKLLYSITKAIE